MLHTIYSKLAMHSGCEDTCTSSQYTRSELVCYWSSEWHYQTDDVAVVHACEARVGNKAVCRSTARQHMLALCFRDCLSSVHIVRPFLSHTQGKKRGRQREKNLHSLFPSGPDLAGMQMVMENQRLWKTMFLYIKQPLAKVKKKKSIRLPEVFKSANDKHLPFCGWFHSKYLAGSQRQHGWPQ